MPKSSLNFIHKRAPYAVVNILKCDMFYGFTASNTTERNSFEFYFLQFSNDSQYYFVYIRLYYCLKYYKNCAQFVSVYVPDEVLYVLTRALLKLLL